MATQTQRTARASKAKSPKARANPKRAARKAVPQRGLTGVTSGLLSQVDLLGMKSAARVAAVSAALGAAAGALARPLVSRRRRPTPKVSLGPVSVKRMSLDGLKKRAKKLSKAL